MLLNPYGKLPVSTHLTRPITVWFTTVTQSFLGIAIQISVCIKVGQMDVDLRQGYLSWVGMIKVQILQTVDFILRML